MDAIDSHNSDWLLNGTLMVVVVGASGDLAKKKTYPSLLNLYDDNMLPTHTLIVGYARSNMTNDELHDRLRPYLLENTSHSPEVVERFLKRCVYQGGAKTYGDVDAFTKVQKTMEECETKFHKDDTMVHNRLVRWRCFLDRTENVGVCKPIFALTANRPLSSACSFILPFLPMSLPKLVWPLKRRACKILPRVGHV